MYTIGDTTHDKTHNIYTAVLLLQLYRQTMIRQGLCIVVLVGVTYIYMYMLQRRNAKIQVRVT